MSPKACETCEKNIEIDIDPDVHCMLDYAAYIFRKLEMIEMNMSVLHVGMERQHILVVKRARDEIQAEIARKQRRKEKEK